MNTHALRQATIALLVLAGAMPAVQAQSKPRIDACLQKAQTDVALYETISAYYQTQVAHDAAMQSARDSGKAVLLASALPATYQEAHAAAHEPPSNDGGLITLPFVRTRRATGSLGAVILPVA